jgi:hypothetical protein
LYPVHHSGGERRVERGINDKLAELGEFGTPVFEVRNKGFLGKHVLNHRIEAVGCDVLLIIIKRDGKIIFRKRDAVENNQPGKIGRFSANGLFHF